jgi:hypothetical protein
VFIVASTAPVPTENQPQRDYRGIPKKTKAIIAALISARNTTKITVSRMENFGKKFVSRYGTGAANAAGKSATQLFYENGGYGGYWPGSGPREW